MGSLISLASGVVGTVLGTIAVRELIDNAPRVSRWLIERAVHRLPERIRDRYREEWKAHADELPSLLSKVFHGIGCWFHAREVAWEARMPSEVDSRDVVVLTRIVHFLFYVIAMKQVLVEVRNRKFKRAAASITSFRSYHYFSGRISRILAESAIANKSRPGGFEREMDEFKTRLEAMMTWAKDDPEGYKHFLADNAKKKKPDAV